LPLDEAFMKRPGTNPHLTLAMVLLTSGCAPGVTAGTEAATGPVTVQPGAPGEDSRRLNAAGLASVERRPHSDADVRFMQGMIHHHAQAVDMVALMEGRTADRSIRRLGLRIDISQRDEIQLMSSWLEDRGEDLPRLHGHGAMGQMLMPGMLSPEQMTALEAAEGPVFERLFLEYMIQHHQGALVMVQELFASPGAGEDSEIFRFANDVDADQAMEIARMRGMLEARR
jgi:uncharacterized protein (DUF305 family)